jgi:uncharacterized protein
MVLEGTVSNVAQFGAFVDLGVHQDGLVHVSQMSRKFVADAREVVRAGAAVKVRVLEVDLARKRIALTMRLDEDAPAARDGAARAGGTATAGGDNRFRPAGRDERNRGGARQPAAEGAMAAAFARLNPRR